ANASVTAGDCVTVTPSAAPSDTCSIMGITAAASGTNQAPFTGTFAVSPTTGAVTITDAKPAGTYTVTVTLLDNCGASASKTFTLTVTNPMACAASFVFIQPAGSPISAGSHPYSVAVGDFNGDGKPDLALANFVSDNVTILLGDGSGGFTQAVGSPVNAG